MGGGGAEVCSEPDEVGVELGFVDADDVIL